MAQSTTNATNLSNIKTFKSTAYKLGIPEGEQKRLANSLAYKGLKNKLKRAEDSVIGDQISDSMTSLDSHQ